MAIQGYIDYQRREYCKDIACPVQVLLEAQKVDSPEYERLRTICQTGCLHTTYEFHHWLMQRGYELVRPEA